ncbi:MauE/DoxX family redox-associated membrane protein [Brevibacillus laterosporus]|uniref:MauE/DoxX family redox-associated membrane protein n=1 Tax=Brevibacillus laterosporus TaxID=1465 RepID=UPI0035A5B284
MTVLSYVIDMIIAVVFFLSFYMKVYHFHDLRLQIHSYQIIPYQLTAISACLLLISEISIFLLFVIGIAYIWKEILVILMLSSFILFIKRKRKISEAADCGCFGKVDSLNKYPIIRNLILIALLIGKLFLPTRIFSLDESIVSGAMIVCFVIAYDIWSEAKQVRELTTDDKRPYHF